MKIILGSTWSKEEKECLLDIWADAHIKSMLENTHKLQSEKELHQTKKYKHCILVRTKDSELQDFPGVNTSCFLYSPVNDVLM